jgi:hypothetical protein
MAYDQDELFLVNFEELLYPVIILDTGSLNGGFDVGIICWSFGGHVTIRITFQLCPVWTCSLPEFANGMPSLYGYMMGNELAVGC